MASVHFTTPHVKEKQFSGIVVDVVNVDALNIKLNGGFIKKIFLASIRPLRLNDEDKAKALEAQKKGLCPDFNVRWVARQMLSRKLMGKRVNVTVDYILPADPPYPEKTCCTVRIGGANVAEALISEGLAAVVRCKQDDDQRSSRYDDLIAADVKHSEYLKRFLEMVKHLMSENLVRPKAYFPYFEGRSEEHCHDVEIAGNANIWANYNAVVITEITPELHFYAQKVDQGPALEQLTSQLRQELNTNPPLAGSYTPKEGDLCAAKLSDGEWCRAKVEKVAGDQVSLQYIDYGSRETTTAVKCAGLPAAYASPAPFAQEYALACIALPKDPEDIRVAVTAFRNDSLNREQLLKVEYKGVPDCVTLRTNDDRWSDIGRYLVADGLVCVESRPEEELKKLVSDYTAAQDSARKRHLNMWQDGYSTRQRRDFGFGKRLNINK